MPHIVTQRCLGQKNRACVEVCPVDCFYDINRGDLNAKYGGIPETIDDERLGMLMIDPDECIDCGACVTECPVEAIFESETVPIELWSFVGLNASITRNMTDSERCEIRCTPTHFKGNGSRIRS